MKETLRAAAEYVRMSTEDQKYSIQNQQAAIAEYARSHDYEVVRSFADPGISGLDIKHRPGLKELLSVVLGGSPGFEVVLVLDVSRWGRFQDIDESAYYEFLCRKVGISVQYCGEPFVNDLSPYSNLIKAIKRTMAAEYSRELGSKVFRGQARLAALGYKQGGQAQIGLRRLLVDSDGKPKQILKRGQLKSLVQDRVILVPGPLREQKFIRGIFQAVVDGRSIPSITEELRKRRRFGRNWCKNSLYELLKNSQYVGTYTYNRTSERLKTKIIKNPPDQWIQIPNLFPPVVPLELWERVQRKLCDHSWGLSDGDYLDQLKELWQKHGYLNARLIDKARDVPSASAYQHRFGSVQNAMRLIGYPLLPNEQVTKRRLLMKLRTEKWEELKANVRQNGLRLRAASYYKYNIHIGGVPIMNFQLARPVNDECRQPLWIVKPPRRARLGRSIIGVLSHDCKEIREYVLTDCLSKTAVTKVRFSLPRLAKLSIARFHSPCAFSTTLRRIGYCPQF